MKKAVSIAIVTVLLIMFASVSGAGHDVVYHAEEEKDSVSTALVDMVADLIEKRGKTDSTIYLVGNVIFHHNGAIIQCDSAKKYSSNMMDFFGHVIVYKDSAYIYGDKASYDGESNLAKVYAPIIKLMRGDASLYTYNLTYNTKTNIGYFSGGGMVIHRDTNHMESMNGMFDANREEIVFRDKVSLKNPSYTAKSDSLKYDLNKGIVTFLTHSTIWTNDNNEILKASSGNILTGSSICRFTKDSYALSSSNEMWSDTLNYDTKTKRITLYGNIQIIDTVHKTIGFGDWGLWDDSIKCAVLTKKPSVISYSSDQKDTLYFRADSLIMTTGDSTVIDDEDNMTPPAVAPKIDSLSADSLSADSLSADSLAADSLQMPKLPMLSDTLAIDSVAKVVTPDTANMELKADTTEKIPRVIRGFRDARGWSVDYQFRSDSIVVHTKDSMGTMYGKPVLWNENNQLIAEQIDLYTHDGDLDWADLTGEPIIIQKVMPKHPVEADSMRFNQAAGQTMQTYFKDNELDSAIMQGNVHNIYWMDHKGFTAAIVDVKCADLTIFFKERTLRRMRWNGNVDWKIYPLEKIDPKQVRYLEKFEWLDDIRPKSSKDISDRTMRESIRESVLKEQRPLFNIELGILYRMRELIKTNSWTDRTEKPSVTPDYFLTR